MEGKYNLSNDELMLFSRTKEGKINEVKCLLNQGQISINCLDEHGMTPLQHAAYKGTYELCKLFIDCGADVNVDHHDHHYSTLMFAALSGNLDVVNLLLENGASTTAINTINRTASQLAAFVGNHDIVSVITNFIRQEEIDWYTEIHNKEKEPKLPITLAKQTHQLVVRQNINPVRLAIFLQTNIALLNESRKVVGVLEHLCGKQLNDNGNEMLSMKMHHLAFVVKACAKCYAELKKQYGEKPLPPQPFERLIKYWIKEEKDKSVPIALEKFIRQSIREYPFPDCPLLQQFVRTLAPIDLGDEPSAISVMGQAIGGQRGLDDSVACHTCGEFRAEKKCSVCKSVQYCDRYCQKLHWFTHKEFCPILAEKYLECKEINTDISTINIPEDENLNDRLQNIAINVTDD